MNRPDALTDTLRCGAPISASAHARVRRAMALDGFKWDAQVGDLDALAPYPLFVRGDTLARLGAWAEDLSREGAAAEAEMRDRPELWGRLGLPHRLRRAMRTEVPWTPVAARIVRYDFHLSEEGWRISEANSDVPGGYTESTTLASLMAEACARGRVWGDVLGALVDALARYRTIVLVAEPRWVEDRQIVELVAAALRQRQCRAELAAPWQIQWRDGFVHLGDTRMDAVFRFFQGELLTHGSWLRGGKTPVCNPGFAMFTESKRFPLVWDALETQLPTWRALMPRCVPPLLADWREPWMLKGACSNTGESVMTSRHARRWRVLLRPSRFVAQRQFRCLSIETPQGPRFPCLGIYTVNGVACGVYGRLSAVAATDEVPIVDGLATDVAVLVDG